MDPRPNKHVKLDIPQVNSHSTKKKVAYFTLYVPHYRVGIFDRLALEPGISFSVYSDQQFPGGFKLPRPSEVQFSLHNTKVYRLSIWFLGISFYYQPACIASLIRGDQDVYILSNRLTELSTLLAPLFALFLRRKIVLWGHGYGRSMGRAATFLRKLIMKRAAACVFYSEMARAEWVKRGLPSKRLFVALNTVDTDVIRNHIYSMRAEALKVFKEREHLEEKKLVIFSARLQREKRPDVLIRAMQILVDRVPDVLGILIGDGPMKSELERLTARLGLEEAVRFAGPVYDENMIARYFLSSKVGVIPAAAGLSLIHFFAYGLPVVVGDDMLSHGPEIEALRPEINGYFCKNADPEDFANRIGDLLTGESKRVRLATEAKKTVECLYNLDTMARGLLDSIVNAASDHHAPHQPS